MHLKEIIRKEQIMNEAILKAYREEIKWNIKTRKRIINGRKLNEAELRVNGYVPLFEELVELDKIASKAQQQRIQQLVGMNNLMRQMGLEEEAHKILMEEDK